MALNVNTHLRVLVRQAVAITALALTTSILHPALATAQSQTGIRTEYSIFFRNPGGNSSRFGGSGTISSSPNGAVNYQFGLMSGALSPGASKDLWNAASLENRANGANVGVKVDTPEGSIRLGSINISPRTTSASIEGVVERRFPADFVFVSAALSQSSEWRESDGSISKALDIYTPWFTLSLLDDGKGHYGGLLTIKDQLIELELPSKAGREVLADIIQFLSVSELSRSANRLSQWYQKIGSK